MAFSTCVILKRMGWEQVTHRAKICASQAKELDTSVYVVTDRRLAGPRGVLYAIERALEGEGPGRRATIVQ